MSLEIIVMVSSTGMLLSKKVTSKLAITALLEFMLHKFLIKEKECLLMKGLTKIRVRSGMKNFAMLYK